VAAALAPAHEPSVSAYSPRAQTRLRIAAALLRFRASSAGSDEAFCTAVLAAIRKMAPPRQEELRTLVNWVEAYERADLRHTVCRITST
jgi:hypothetical protein